mmetsp:Transcript_68204/g.192276  ORF Transcript_68204/g.192276 Transcript_68204/m.192276 type:complete len:319 (+) Transcript_68204:81-1037(+)
MAKAGEHYATLTGNIWSYANRGDLTGVKAALMRGGVGVNAQNIAGWTPLHAACAGGHGKVVGFLLRSGADVEARDAGGNTPAHEAAKSGSVQALEQLASAGARLEAVRLSQCRGQAARALVAEATRRAGTDGGEQGDGDDGAAVSVGYERKQAKSNAFFGPRRTPISCKIKKQILHDRRARRQEGDAPVTGECGGEAEEEGAGDEPDGEPERCPEMQGAVGTAGMSWSEAVAAVKSSKPSRRARRAKALRDNQQQQQQQQQQQPQPRQCHKEASDAEPSDHSTASGTAPEVHAQPKEHPYRALGFAALAHGDTSSDSE